MKFLLIATALIGLASSQCPSNDQYCAKCVGSVCGLCYAAFWNAQGSCSAVSTTVANCLSYAADGLCLVCAPNYYLDGSLKCQKIPIANCEVYANSTCVSCANGTLVANNSCAGNATCSVQNCNSCDSDNTCSYCKSGYGLDAVGNKCVSLKSAPVNCLVQGSAGCLACSFGFYDNNGTCTASGQYKSAALVMTSLVGLLAALFN